VENTQVTFAVQAAGVRGRVGRPILIVAEAFSGIPQQLIWFRASPFECAEVARREVPGGPLTAFSMDVIQAQTAAELSNALAFWKGIQAVIETSP
jgi:hypothetical protein